MDLFLYTDLSTFSFLICICLPSWTILSFPLKILPFVWSSVSFIGALRGFQHRLSEVGSAHSVWAPLLWGWYESFHGRLVMCLRDSLDIEAEVVRSSLSTIGARRWEELYRHGWVRKWDEEEEQGEARRRKGVMRREITKGKKVKIKTFDVMRRHKVKRRESV